MADSEVEIEEGSETVSFDVMVYRTTYEHITMDRAQLRGFMCIVMGWVKTQVDVNDLKELSNGQLADMFIRQRGD